MIEISLEDSGVGIESAVEQVVLPAKEYLDEYRLAGTFAHYPFNARANALVLPLCGYQQVGFVMYGRDASAKNSANPSTDGAGSWKEKGVRVIASLKSRVVKVSRLLSAPTTLKFQSMKRLPALLAP